MKKMIIFAGFAAAMLYVTPSARAGCTSTILDVEVTTITDDSGKIISQSRTEYWGWLCTSVDVGNLVPPVTVLPPGWVGPPPPPPVQPEPQPQPLPVPQPPPDCSLSKCEADCVKQFSTLIELPAPGTSLGDPMPYLGPEPGKCGVFCSELQDADMNACLGMCVSDCNLP